jgi:hypothetical protein
MTPLTPRLQAVFEKTKTVCFGRFLVEVPETATVAWGKSSIELGIVVYSGGADKVRELAEKFVDELKNAKAMNHDYVPLFLAEEETAQPTGKIITGYEGFDAVNGLKIRGYFNWGDDGVIINALPLQENRSMALAEIKSIARRLRPRADDEIPPAHGNCLEHAFLADKLVAGTEPPNEHIRIGFRLSEFPDTHLSIYIAPPNRYNAESDTLEWQLNRREKAHRAENLTHLLLRTKYFRRGPRQIHDWLNGWEALSRSPDQSGVHGVHDFVMDVKGVLKDVYKPYADIRMQTGVRGNLAGAVKPSLTDDEAIAVWDRITSSIRVRPTSAPVKSSVAPRLPLGELAATGSACPEGGWWEPVDTGLPQRGSRQRFNKGQAMPAVVQVGAPSLWQKIKGERPAFSAATVWKLVGYADEGPATSTATHIATEPKRGEGA